MKAFNRKTIIGVLAMCAMTTAIVTPTSADQTTDPRTIHLTRPENDNVITTPSIIIDGSNLKTDVPPYIYSSTTMVPLRVISEYLGANVEWDAESRSIHIEKGLKYIDLTIGENIAHTNEGTIAMGISPKLVDGRTMVPLRFISEALECAVDWDADTKTVTITSGEDAVILPTEDVDAYGRKMRTTNLPSNAKDFPYIAEGVPNWCYEIQPLIMKNNCWGPSWYTDTGLKGDTAAAVAEANSSLFPQNCSDGVYELVDKFVNLQTNTDYNTMGEEWVNGVLSCFSDTEIKSIEKQWVNDPIKTIKEELEATIQMYKKSQNITTCEAQVLPEAMWVDIYGFPHVPVYIKYTINNNTFNGKLLNITFGGTAVGASLEYGFKVGQTYETVVTYTLTKDSKGVWKIAYSSCDFDDQVNPSVDATDGINPATKDSKRLNSFRYYWTKDGATVDRYAHPKEDQIRESFNHITGT